jgi:hypothetical protein
MTSMPNAARPALNDEAMISRIQAVFRVEPDPLFGRRLRGAILNQYVAAREGLIPRRAVRPEMGRVGRACLHASVLVAATVASAAAASQSALPGDLLYSMKLEIEAVRMGAAPNWMRDDLAVFALDARLAELDTLLQAGAWERATIAAAEVNTTLATLSLADPEALAEAEARVAARVAHLSSILAAAPEAAQKGLLRALQGGDGGNHGGSGSSAGGQGADSVLDRSGQGASHGSAGAGAEDHPAASDATGVPSISVETSASPAASSDAKASGEARGSSRDAGPDAVEEPEATPPPHPTPPPREQRRD